MRHLMLDLETWGTRPGCAIRSVGAVQFDPEQATFGDEFYCNVDDKSCKKLKLHVDPDTAEWWARQSLEAQNSLKKDPLPITEVLSRFTEFVNHTRVQFIWSQGSNFDEPIISHIYHLIGQKAPWKFWDTRDTRTAYDLARFNSRTVTRAGTYHNALDDAIHQAKCVMMSYARLKGKML